MPLRGEFRLIERLKSLIPRPLQGKIPIGDDAAVLPPMRGRDLLFTTDTIVEGVDFILGRGGATPEAIGRKALAVNLSDIAAMGGKPLAFVVAWGLPKKCAGAWTLRAAKGMLHLARRFNVSWVGGDLSRSERIFISIALLGEAQKGKAVLRKGARAGDSIYVTGKLGGSIEGKHLTFEPRLREAQFLVKRFRPSAMIDISDGFIQDLGHILDTSNVGAQIDLEKIPVSKVTTSKRMALKSALTDGEDFELLFTLPPAKVKKLEAAWQQKFHGLSLTRVGRIVRTHPKQIVWHQDERPLKKLWFQKTGFTHF